MLALLQSIEDDKDGVEKLRMILADYPSLLRKKNGLRQTIVHIAAENSSCDILRLVLRDADLEARDSSNRTPLMIAAWSGKSRNMRILLEAKASINATGAFNDTALVLAAYANKLLTVEVLMDFGARTDLTGEDGMTAHEWAVHLEYARVSRLLDTGRRENQRNWQRLAVVVSFYRHCSHPLKSAVFDLVPEIMEFTGLDPASLLELRGRDLVRATKWKWTQRAIKNRKAVMRRRSCKARCVVS